MSQLNICGIVAIALMLTCSHAVDGYKVLGVLHTAARSHHIVGSALMKGLARAGHEVTVLSPFPLKEPLENYHDIETPSIIAIMADDITNLLDTLNHSVIENVASFHTMGVKISDAFLNEPGVQELMRSNQTFDVVISEVFLSESLFGLSEHFHAPLIGLGTFGAIAWNTDMVGSPSPPSYVPNAMLPFTDHMTLFERIANLAFLTFERLLLNYYYLPRQEAVYKKHFPNATRSMYEVRKNTALVLLNQHVSLSSPRPYVPNQIEVGGMHINRQRKPLPANIQKFIDEAKHGVIYFSMGSNLKSKNLPIEKRQVILDTFRAQKQRVLWKFEDPDLEGKPDNVFISDWFPQDDILAHPNVRAFITHGGLLSTTESIYHAKPFIGIPIFGDQFINMARAEKLGYGIKVDYFKLNTDTLNSAIQRIVNEASYTERIRAMSERFRDPDMQPLDRAIHWVEHVARYKGAEYLHCAGQDLNFIQYHNIDAMVILYGGILILLMVFLKMVRYIFRAIFCRSERQTEKLKRQ